ncbi:MAG: hypothetical protein AVO38_09155 [delta proteobacterium ML8_D]|nr:MAG: hypothetical protein AVO38_09155 [delta proteobacterium ML8_D]
MSDRINRIARIFFFLSRLPEEAVKAQYPQRKKRQKILSCKFFLSDRINRISRIFFFLSFLKKLRKQHLFLKSIQRALRTQRDLF